MMLRPRSRLLVPAALVLLAGASIAASVGGTVSADVADAREHPARAAAPSDLAADAEITPLHIAEKRTPRPTDAPLFATLAIVATLATLAGAVVLLHRLRSHVSTAALVPCGLRAPPFLLAP